MKLKQTFREWNYWGRDQGVSKVSYLPELQTCSIPCFFLIWEGNAMVTGEGSVFPGSSILLAGKKTLFLAVNLS